MGLGLSLRDFLGFSMRNSTKPEGIFLFGGFKFYSRRSEILLREVKKSMEF